jgi:hypothetical protein
VAKAKIFISIEFKQAFIILTLSRINCRILNSENLYDLQSYSAANNRNEIENEWMT